MRRTEDLQRAAASGPAAALLKIVLMAPDVALKALHT